MKIKTFSGLILFFLCGAAVVSAQNLKFDYLKIKGNTVKTTHQARYKIKINKSFKPLGELHHQPTYGEKQFNVSLAAFSSGADIIMIHAETHTDKSGGLDYSNLKADSLDDLKFTSREQCAPAEAEAELATNPQIKFLREKGFQVKLPFLLKQYFATAPDGTAEVVISYGMPVSTCDESSATFGEFKAQSEKKLRENIEVEKIK